MRSRAARTNPGLNSGKAVSSINTPMMESLPPETTAAITANIPFPARLGLPEEYGLMVAQIVENPYLNGTTIRLDGAVRLPPR